MVIRMTDEDPIVLVPPYKGRSLARFHTDLGCPNASKDALEWPLSKAKRWDMTECKVCSDGHTHGTPDHSYQRALKRAAEEADD